MIIALGRLVEVYTFNLCFYQGIHAKVKWVYQLKMVKLKQM